MITITHECVCDACGSRIHSDKIEWSGVGEPRSVTKAPYGFRSVQTEHQLCYGCGYKMQQFFINMSNSQ